ncbi:hypothetical protein [Ahrensia sp. R2A130]|uniref:hypothetical protein n=1 Tax=Ahrensia sp. R2A130 TaxID=744979 RepID=UPI0001E0D7F1|nr:hypothetical protein [Ahrensia sp. R2A130]EFL90305.1 DNA-binding protein [Ahrensia sp. R2A130]
MNFSESGHKLEDVKRRVTKNLRRYSITLIGMKAMEDQLRREHRIASEALEPPNRRG